METNLELKKIKKTKPKILIIEEDDKIEKVETEQPINIIINKGTGTCLVL